MPDPETIHRIGAGASGSFVAVWLARAVGKEAVLMFVCGLSAAYFFAPALAEWLFFKTPEMKSATAFAVGLFVLNIASAVIAWIKSVDLNSVIPFFSKKKGG